MITNKTLKGINFRIGQAKANKMGLTEEITPLKPFSPAVINSPKAGA